MKISPHFKEEEFACKCGCGEMRISPSVVLICEMVRSKFRMPVTITSGCRCKEYNEEVGGAEHSQHMPKGDEMCHAADIRVRGVSPQVVYKFIDEQFPHILGLGLYSSWVHVDDRMDGKYRW